MNTPTVTAGAIAEEQTTRRLSCDRCHTTKIRCQRLNSDSCVRCHRRGVECVYSARLPRGRPRAKSNRPLPVPPLEGSVGAGVTGSSKNSDRGHANANRGAAGSRSKTAKSNTVGNVRQRDGALASDFTDLITTMAASEAKTTPTPTSSSGTHDVLSYHQLFETDMDAIMSDPLLLGSPQSNAWYSSGNTLTSTPTPTTPSFDPGHCASPTHTTEPIYVENGFWAHVHGEDTQFNAILGSLRSPWGAMARVGALTPFSASTSASASAHANKGRAGLAELVRSIPARSISDALVHLFVVSVLPMHPILHLGTFRQYYETFWRLHDARPASGSSATSTTPFASSLSSLEDSSFVALLFAVLFCGASAAPPSSWAAARPLATLNVAVTVKNLQDSYLAALHHCQCQLQDPGHPDSSWRAAPTANVLTAMLLGHVSPLAATHEPFRDASGFVHMVVRMARSMGLHRERSWSLSEADLDHDREGDRASQDHRRNIWWHILHIDVESALRTGSQTCCGLQGTHWDVTIAGEPPAAAAVAALRDCYEESSLSMDSLSTMTAPPAAVPASSSSFSVFATGRNLMTRFMHDLLNCVNSCQTLNQQDLNVRLDAFKQLHGQVAVLLSRLPVAGVPESGYLPLRLANASPMTHHALYSEQSVEPSIFHAWARNVLNMMLTGCLLFLQRVFLNHPSLAPDQNDKMWTTSFHLSVELLGHLVRIKRVPAFSPYLWSCQVDVSTLQATFIILNYLKRMPSSPGAQTAKYLVDEVLEMLSSSLSSGSSSNDGSTTVADSNAGETGQKVGNSLSSHQNHHHGSQESVGKESWAAIWRLFKAARMKLDSPKVAPQVPATHDYLYSVAENIQIPLADHQNYLHQHLPRQHVADPSPALPPPVHRKPRDTSIASSLLALDDISTATGGARNPQIAASVRPTGRPGSAAANINYPYEDKVPCSDLDLGSWPFCLEERADSSFSCGDSGNASGHECGRSELEHMVGSDTRESLDPWGSFRLWT